MSWSRLLLTFLLVPLVHSQNIKLHHRIFHPTSATLQVPFSERGIVTLSDTGHPTFEPSKSFSQDLVQFAQTIAQEDGNDIAQRPDASLLLYQVALEHPGDTIETQWDISSVKVCHLHQVTSESLILHTNSNNANTPYALDYFVAPVPHDGACPKRKNKSKAKSTPGSPGQPSTPSLIALSDKINALAFNTSVKIQASRLPPLPELRTPPSIVLSPEGTPEQVQPKPEKSFIQKYWMYAGAILIALLMSGGGAEEEQPRRAGGGGGGGAQ